MIHRSSRLDHVFYEIRGPIYEQAQSLERQGYKIIRLNIGNPAPFGFDVPDEMVQDLIFNIRNAQGYAESKGLFAARKAIMQYAQSKAIRNVEIEDIFVGNGVSELIMISMQALLNEGDEILVPAPDYPLWTSAINLYGGKAVHYICDEASDWYPDVEDIKKKITSRTRGIVIINPNNPTGAVYPVDVLKKIAKIAVEHKLIIFSDEIYDKILYDGIQHTALASLTDETLCVTYGGLSKNYRAAGFRAAWMILSGARAKAKPYIEGLTLLANMRICSNVPSQFAIQTALGGYQSINDLVAPEGRLRKQRDLCYEKLSQIPGISLVKPKGALYAFPKIDLKKFNLKDDYQFVFDLLTQQRVLVVHGTGFNYHTPDHFRIVFLPPAEELALAIERIGVFLEKRLMLGEEE